MTDLRRVRIPIPARGMDTLSNWRNADRQASGRVDNLILRNPGRATIRGPLRNQGPLWPASASRYPLGHWIWNNRAYLGAESTLTLPFVGKYGIQSLPANWAPYNILVDLGTSTFATYFVIGNATTPRPISASARLGDYTYGLAIAAAGSVTTVDGITFYKRQIGRWDGTTAVPTIYANAPTYGLDVCAYASRLWVLSGLNAVGAGVVGNSSLYYSDPGGPTSDLAAFWTDDVSGLHNQIVIGADDRTDYPIGLALIEGGMAIFKRNSIHVLRGSGSTTFQVKQVISGGGGESQESICEADGGVYFMASGGGIKFFDGYLVRDIAPRIEEFRHPSYFRWSISVPDSEHLLITRSQSLESTDHFLLHRPTGSVVKVTGTSAMFGATDVATTGTIGDTAFYHTQKYFIESFELTGPKFGPSFSNLGTDIAGSGVQAAITPFLRYPLAPLADSMDNIQLHRMILHYRAVRQDLAADTIAWSVKSNTGATLQSGTVAFATSQYTEPNETYAVVDVFTECTPEAFIELSWTSNAIGTTGVYDFDIYEAELEYQVTRQRR